MSLTKKLQLNLEELNLCPISERNIWDEKAKNHALNAKVLSYLTDLEVH